MGSKQLMLLRNARCVPKHRNTKIKERGYNLLSIPLGRFKEGSPQTSLGVGPNFSGRRNPEASALIKIHHLIRNTLKNLLRLQRARTKHGVRHARGTVGGT